MPTELKHASAQTAHIALIENPISPRFEVDAYRLDGGFILYATDERRKEHYMKRQGFNKDTWQSLCRSMAAPLGGSSY